VCHYLTTRSSLPRVVCVDIACLMGRKAASPMTCSKYGFGIGSEDREHPIIIVGSKHAKHHYFRTSLVRTVLRQQKELPLFIINAENQMKPLLESECRPPKSQMERQLSDIAAFVNQRHKRPVIWGLNHFAGLSYAVRASQ